MAACSIFDEDEVCIPTSSGGFKYGLVVESSEYVSSDDDDDDDENRVQKGTVKIAWHPSGDETVVPEKKLILTDRSLMPGDVVRRLINGEESQRGFVQNMEMKSHVKILGTEQYIYNIDVRDIKPIQEWDPEPEVTLDSWVGHVLEVNEEITVKFPDGARCKLENAGMLDLEDINDRRKDHSEFAMRNFYPGQELCGTHEDFLDAKWLQTTNLRGPKALGAKPLYTVPVVVEKVETKSVDVRWICKGFTRSGVGADKLESPPKLVDGDNLKRMRRLDCFEHCHIQIGDKGYYVVKENDTLVHNMNPRKYVTPDIVDMKTKDNMIVLGTRADGLVVLDKKELSKENKQQRDPKLKVPKSDAVEPDDGGTCGDDEFEDVDDNSNDEASDGSSNHSEGNVPTQRRRNRKRPCLQTRSLKKLKGKKAKKKQKAPEREVKPGDRVAVEIWYTFSLCNIMWQNGTVEMKVPSPNLFPIHHLDELEFFPGDFVIDSKGNMSTDYGVVVSCDHKERTIQVKWMKPYLPNKTPRPEESSIEELSVYDVKDHQDYKFRSGNTVIRVAGFEDDGKDVEAVGQVYRLDPDGTIQVWWPDKNITKCYPQDLYIISEEFSDNGSSDGWTDEEEEEEEEEGSDVSWETEEEEEEEGADAESEEETQTDGQKNLWAVSDGKKKDFDELLKRVQAALTGLLDIFINVPGPFLKNSKQVFLDILAIFKRCKEMEKILKSSFFDDDDITELIREIKDELRKEKTSKFARHVAQVYKYRSNTFEHGEKTNESAKHNRGAGDGERDSPGGVCRNDNGANGSMAEGEAGASGQTTFTDDAKTQRMRDAIAEYGSNIDDPILQIIFDNSLHATIAKSAQRSLQNAKTPTSNIVTETLTQTSSSDSNIAKTHICSSAPDDNGEIKIVGPAVNGVCDTGDQNDILDKPEEDMVGLIETVIKSVCDEKNEVEKALKTVKDKLEYMCNGTNGATQGNEDNKDAIIKEDNQSDSLSSKQTESKSEIQSDCSTLAQADAGTGSRGDTVLPEKGPQTCDDKDEDNVLPSSHRTLCIRVCKALNTQLLHIQQEINRRWLASKFGCDENVTEEDLFLKMQQKMIDSVESGNGPLSLSTENACKTGEVLIGESVQELESLIESRAPPSGESSPDKEEETAAITEQQENAASQTGFEMCSETATSHWFKYQEHKPGNMKTFSTAIRKELMLLQSSLPKGILVKGFEDRMDLYSVLIQGPACTPYEDGLFAFDVQLPSNFPSAPPVFHYLSFCNERLNPNLYENGKVCISLLGTWSGKGNEVWTNKSNLLQVLVSIQGLILVSEPYFNEAGYERQRGTQHGQENSKMYNELAILKLVQSMTKMAVTPPTMFVEETKSHLQKHAQNMVDRIEHWINLSANERLETNPENSIGSGSQSESSSATGDQPAETAVTIATKPDFPLLPASKGFCLTVKKNIDIFKTVLAEHIFKKDI